MLRALAGAVALAATAAAQSPAPRATRPRTLAEDLQLFSQVLNQLRVNHPDSLDSHTLLISAIEGLVHAADPHSFVIPAVRLDSARRAALLDGKLQPVLIDFAFVEGAPIVVAVTPGSRASRLDIMVGDELTDVAGQPVSAESPDELGYALAGPAGTSVDLRFDRRRADGSVVALARTVPRERAADVTGVPFAGMLDARTGYVRVTTFMADHLADDLNTGVERLEKHGMQRLVLDLRDNGGGRVDQAAAVAGTFLPSGSIVYTTWSRKAELIDTGRVSRSFWRSARTYPIAVLVNAGTASASELVAGALQDHDRATVVGHTTFGKALIMQTVPLSDGSLMEIVVGRMSTPCGRVIQREYHGVSQRHYLRTAGAAMDTAGKPACVTPAGRRLYGGGGIVPDVILPPVETPAWLTRLGETDAFLTWSSGYRAAHPDAVASLDSVAAHALPTQAREDFRGFAHARGVEVPADARDDEILDRALRRLLAYAAWGAEGEYRVVAATDPEVAAAVRSMP